MPASPHKTRVMTLLVYLKKTMTVKKAYLAAIGIFLFVMMVGAPLLYTADRAGIITVKDMGNTPEQATVYSGTPFDGPLNALSAIKASITNLYTNFMPGYYEIVYTYSKLESSVNAPFMRLYSRARAELYKSLLQPEEIPAVLHVDETDEPPPPDPHKVVSVSSTLLYTSGIHRYYRVDIAFEDGKEVSFLDTAVILSDKEKEARVKVQAKRLRRIAESNEDVNFYFMLLTRMQDTDYFEDIIPGEESTKEYADLFLSLLGDNITKLKWDIGTVRDRTERVYLTDHHWTVYGSYIGFLQLCAAICPDHTPVKLGEAVDFPDTRFYGSYARMCQTMDLWDEFRVYDFGLGPFVCTPHWDFEGRVAYLQQQKFASPDINVYAEFFPKVNIVEYPENRTGRNLLVIGDSYTQGFVQLLGSAFDKTTVFYYDDYPGMHYNSVIKQLGITDVLFLQFSDRILFDMYGDDKLSFIRLD